MHLPVRETHTGSVSEQEILYLQSNQASGPQLLRPCAATEAHSAMRSHCNEKPCTPKLECRSCFRCNQRKARRAEDPAKGTPKIFLREIKEILRLMSEKYKRFLKDYYAKLFVNKLDNRKKWINSQKHITYQD